MINIHPMSFLSQIFLGLIVSLSPLGPLPREVLERPYTGGGGGNPPPLDPPPSRPK